MAWQRLSVRTGKRKPATPYDGVPPHLIQPLVRWLQDYFVDGYGALRNASTLRYFGIIHEVAVPANADDYKLLNQILNQCAQDGDFCLDMLDSLLKFGQVGESIAEGLDVLLALGGSVWRIGPDREALVERLDDTAMEQSSLAMTPQDEASAELAEAWKNAYGRNPNASDAWDHAIKALETILIPIVCPAKSKPTLADVAGCLKAQPDKWNLQLQSNGVVGSIETLEAMLRLIWPNPDRHGGAARRTPTPGEAQAVVQLAVVIVQWGRADVLTKVQ